MKAKLKASTLNTMLKAANKFIDKKTMLLEVNGKIALIVHDGLFELKLFSLTDSLEFSRAVPMESEYNDDFERMFEAEDGAWTVDAKAFAPVKGASKKSDVIISADKDMMTVSADGLSFQAKAVRGAFEGMGFVDTKAFGEAVSEMEIDDADCAAYKYIAPAMSDDMTRIAFTGARIQDGKLVATDGHRLHVAPLSPVISGDFHASILNPALVKAIAGGMKGTLREYVIEKEKVSWCVLEGDGYRLAAKSIPDTFPDFAKVFPRPDYTCEIDAQAFAAAVKALCAGWKCSTLAIYQNGDLCCAGRGKNAKDMPRNSKFLGFHESPFAKCGRLTKRVGLDPQYIIDALADTECAQFCTVDEDNPVWLGEYDGVSFGRGAIIMPIEI